MKKALEANDAKAIDRTLEALMQAQQKAAENAVQERRARRVRQVRRVRRPGPAAGNGKADDVIDAEVVEEKK